ncbi:MAG: hypothetical protein EBS68_11130, partial [Rhodobacteraceae bacterium]|nr:hypothetical protein [Paracoccaceae bacterium]
GGGNYIAPSVNEKDPMVRAGADDPTITITGTAQPGSTVTVVIGGETVVTTATSGGTWTTTFTGTDFPVDGEYDVAVKVVETNGTTTDLDGPHIVIDTVAPDVDFTQGTNSVIHVENLADYTDGVTITGQGEPGSSISVTVLNETKTTTVAADGTWSVTYSQTEVPGGEYETDVLVTSTDAYGNSASYTDKLVIDTVPHDIDIATSLVGGNGTVNFAEEGASGVTVTGTSTPGAVMTVVVTADGQTFTQTVTTGANGGWSANWPAGTFPGGEYDADVTVSTVDGAGNPSSTTGSFHVDTLGMVTISSNPIAGNDVVNNSEAAGGVVLTGTTQPGSIVTVVVEGVSRTATAGADGAWSVTYGAGSLPSGTYQTTAQVTSTDAAGNTATATRTFNVDTEADVAINIGQSGGDDLVNGAERSAGIVLTGTTEPGSSVEITLGSVTRAATVGADGKWTVNFSSAELPQGEGTLNVTAKATDTAGNVTTATSTLDYDTQTAVGVATQSTGTDAVMNAAERAMGVVLTGTSEAGSTSVVVNVNGKAHPATVAANGSWTVTIPTTDLPQGEGSVPVTVTSTDAAGNTAQASATLGYDTLVNALTAGTTAGGADHVVNAAEHGGGVVITGQTEPGSTVMVQLGTATVPAVVAANGSWTATFTGAQVPTGEQVVPVTATATDAAGNTRVETTSVTVDTVPNALAIGPAAVEGDNVINLAESLDGATITGTSVPNAVVTVNFGSGTRQVVTNGSGQWTANFLRSELPADTDAATVTATTVDAAGNSSTVTTTVGVDTVVQNLGVSGGAGLVNSASLSSGVVLTGTTEAGSTRVDVTLDGKTVVATVNPDGTWTAPFAGNMLPTGEKTVTLSVTATDKHGNIGTTSQSVQVDTFVNRLENSATAVETDNVVNAAEARDGVVLTGRVEAGSSVNLVYNGTSYAATVGANGLWSATLPASAFSNGDYTATVQIHATDAAGNHSQISRSFAVDTVAPDGPLVESYTRDHLGISRISVETNGEDLTVSELKADNTITVDRAEGVPVDVLGETLFSFSPRVPDGSHLIVNSTDAAGNTSGTYLVLDEMSTSVVDLPAGLSAHQIEAIDLQFAEDSHLTITEAQLKALSTNSDTVTIHGGSDDTVTALGAVAAGSVQVEGQGYTVYTLGADGRLIIDEDITVLI